MNNKIHQYKIAALYHSVHVAPPARCKEGYKSLYKLNIGQIGGAGGGLGARGGGGAGAGAQANIWSYYCDDRVLIPLISGCHRIISSAGERRAAPTFISLFRAICELSAPSTHGRRPAERAGSAAPRREHIYFIEYNLV
ncbi:jg27057 [Pararge aegeria aegeria]|uniref:Jg27057 protein n=1 Tax=Pararge aegeria aegeria TaxID=348720 RepID=A0A8S4SAT8_9NEOP|nr:jg27057 [Pararge aegeria aegeria]